MTPALASCLLAALPRYVPSDSTLPPWAGPALAVAALNSLPAHYKNVSMTSFVQLVAQKPGSGLLNAGPIDGAQAGRGCAHSLMAGPATGTNCVLRRRLQPG